MYDAYTSDDDDDPIRRTPKMENEGNATMLRAPNCYNQFTEKETAPIMERYIENYEAYHNKQLGKFGESLSDDKSKRMTWNGTKKKLIVGKKEFLASLTEEVNSIGVSVRTEKQIDQKIRDEMKTVKKYATAVNADVWTQKMRFFDDEAPRLEEQVQTVKPPKIIKKEDSSKNERELREQLIEAELKNAQLRRENLLMEQQILEAKLAYWNEKRRSYFGGTTV